MVRARTKMNKLCFYSLGLLVYTAVLTHAITCEDGDAVLRPYTCQSCLDFRLEGNLPFGTAQAQCTLTLVQDDSQLFRLSAYLRVLVQESSGPDRFWVGYRHVNSSTVQDVSGNVVSSGPVTEVSNFVSGETPADGVCVAVDKNGNFTNELCTQELPFICARTYNVPSVSVNEGVRFITDGGMAQFTCTGEGSLGWRRDGMEIPGNGNGIVISTDGMESNLTIGSFDGTLVGVYECVATNAVGAAVSRRINLELDTTGSPGTAPTVSISEPSLTSLQLGTTLSLSCNSPDNPETVEWLLNGAALSSDPALVVDTFTTPGVYQCRVTNSNGDSSVATRNICGLDGVPGRMDELAVSPTSQTSVVVRWVAPLDPNVEHTDLLSYQIFYHPAPASSTFDIDNSQSPDDNMLVIDPEKSFPLFDFSLGEFEVTGLAVGTRYLFTMQASSSIDAGDMSDTSVVATHGLPPDEVLEITSVSRTVDNKTLVVSWNKIDLELPFGPLAKYQLEYRDFQKEFSSTVFVDPRFAFFVIQNLENAATYEVRVAAVVVVASDDRGTTETERNEFTDWVRVNGIVTTVPSPPPTVMTGRVDPSRATVIATAVVVPLLVVFLVLLIVGVGVFCLYMKKKDKDSGGRERTESSAIALTRATDRSSPQPDTAEAGTDEKPPLSSDI